MRIINVPSFPADVCRSSAVPCSSLDRRSCTQVQVCGTVLYSVPDCVIVITLHGAITQMVHLRRSTAVRIDHTQLSVGWTQVVDPAVPACSRHRGVVDRQSDHSLCLSWCGWCGWCGWCAQMCRWCYRHRYLPYPVISAVVVIKGNKCHQIINITAVSLSSGWTDGLDYRIVRPAGVQVRMDPDRTQLDPGADHRHQSSRWSSSQIGPSPFGVVKPFPVISIVISLSASQTRPS